MTFFLIKNIDSCVWCLMCVPWTMDFLVSYVWWQLFQVVENYWQLIDMTRKCDKLNFSYAWEPWTLNIIRLDLEISVDARWKFHAWHTTLTQVYTEHALNKSYFIQLVPSDSPNICANWIIHFHSSLSLTFSSKNTYFHSCFSFYFSRNVLETSNHTFTLSSQCHHHSKPNRMRQGSMRHLKRSSKSSTCRIDLYQMFQVSLSQHYNFTLLLFPLNWLCKKRTSELQCKFSPKYLKCLEQESSTIVKMCSTPSENRRQLPWKRFKVQRQRHSTEWLNFSTAIGSIKRRWTRQTIRVSEAAVRARRQSIVAWVVNVRLSEA